MIQNGHLAVLLVMKNLAVLLAGFTLGALLIIVVVAYYLHKVQIVSVNEPFHYAEHGGKIVCNKPTCFLSALESICALIMWHFSGRKAELVTQNARRGQRVFLFVLFLFVAALVIGTALSVLTATMFI